MYVMNVLIGHVLCALVFGQPDKVLIEDTSDLDHSEVYEAFEPAFWFLGCIVGCIV